MTRDSKNQHISTFSHQFIGRVFPFTFELAEASLATKQWITFNTEHQSEHLLVLAVDVMHFSIYIKRTRMHSSSMRTTRSLTVSRSILWGGLADPL